MARRVPLCIFAKPPVPGRAKTRLAAAVGAEVACQLASAFVNDSIALVLQTSSGYPVLATTEDGLDPLAFPDTCFPPGVSREDVPRWQQPAGDLGFKIEAIARRGLQEAGAVLCLGADSPGRPLSRLEDALRALEDGTVDAVLGPTLDGGFDLLALSSCPEGLLAELPWSQATTCEATSARLQAQGMRVLTLMPWWDVDEVEDLARLRQHLREQAAEGLASAPAAAAVLAACDGAKAAAGE
eukprot:TRINITY_DN38020_c0_g1_i1.p1 TRINITY_DN38020_c0_g1~~TRINITY_DN38020_c0_g1_i1.p1  ORF type:complete len:241 (-),score=57.25 TRINITY_DN38020_c0_g1_i1:297-1019(-)